MTSLTDLISRVTREFNCEVTEAVTLPPRQASFAPIPDALHPDLRSRLARQYPGGLYRHQTLGIERALAGDSLCVTTPTASGKTLIFTAAALSTLLSKPGSVVLALYPAKALIHDQEMKWRAAAEGTGLSAAIIHGGVERAERERLLESSRILLMTPDVLHAWLLANLDSPMVKRFLGALAMVILDEAHIYDGVFGTNMACLLRRLRAASGVAQFLTSSATIGDPAGFLGRLTGITPTLIGAELDGTASSQKEVILARLPARKSSQMIQALIGQLNANTGCRYLVFADSRKKVEELAAAAMTPQSMASDDVAEPVTEGEEIIDTQDLLEELPASAVLPYRAGYEEHDRNAIQQALTQGRLRDVISTSALELGVDIGEITLVINLGIPPTTKSFWQRAGRAGRASAGHVLLLDLEGRISRIGLNRYLQLAPEPNWLYLENEYLQYANVLCAAEEHQQASRQLYREDPFRDLPEGFMQLLENELSPTRSIPTELYPIKQSALSEGSPHKAFPLRTSVERNFTVESQREPGRRLGSLTWSQLLREAFPGAIYRYMGRPYRVWSVKHGKGVVTASRINGRGVTRPTALTMVFPRFHDELMRIARSDSSFIAESRMQVSMRLIGFVEQYGKNSKQVSYEPGCSYSQKPLNNYFDTTGVCFYFDSEGLQREALGRYIASAFCRVCSIQDRDVGSGLFTSPNSSIGDEQVRGFAVFDSTVGSLRLTRQLPARLDEVLEEAIRMAREEEANRIAANLEELRGRLPELKLDHGGETVRSIFDAGSEDGWRTVVASNQLAILHDGSSHLHEEVVVLGYVYTPQGLRYRIKHQDPSVNWMVAAQCIQPVNGVTALEQYNINTGDTRPDASGIHAALVA